MAGGWEEYLDSLAAFGMRPGLERVQALLAALGHPERSFLAVHIVGTNGKSSTTRYVEALLRAHGRRSGAYLSPHLSGYPERVVIDGRAVEAAVFGRAVEMVRTLIPKLPGELGETTQFEVLTVAALLAMAESGVEAAAVEAGLGGRLDATNVLRAPVVVLTNVALEHTEVLGPTREAIFAEKAAVIHGGDAVFGPLDGLEPLARARCAQAGARAHLWGEQVRAQGEPHDFTVTLGDERGERSYARLAVPTLAAYQVDNAALAVAAADVLLGGLEESRVRQGLIGTAVPGRLQVLRRLPLVIADGAHNPHGATALAAALRSLLRPSPRIGLFAMMRDKAVDDMLAALLPLVDRVVCTAASLPRSLGAEELAQHVRRTAGAGGLPVDVVSHPWVAYARALDLAGQQGSVLVTGSLYLLEDLAGTLGAEGGGND